MTTKPQTFGFHDFRKLNELFPFEVAQGDTIKRLCPEAQQRLNSTTSWLVSQECKTGHKLIPLLQGLNNLLPLLEKYHDIAEECKAAMDYMKRDLLMRANIGDADGDKVVLVGHGNWLKFNRVLDELTVLLSPTTKTDDERGG